MRLPSAFRSSLVGRPWLVALLLGATTVGCDRGGGTAAADTAATTSAAARAAAGGGGSDPQWRADSTLIAGTPGVLFRVVRTPTLTQAVPVMRMGPGFGALALSPRGWRAFDVAYLYEGRTLTPLRGGTALPPVQSRRGMWEGVTLDSLTGCTQLLPGGAVSVPDGAELMVGGRAPRYVPDASLPPGMMDDALQRLATLVAPSAGVAMTRIKRFERTLHVVPHGSDGKASLLALYRDPTPAPDTVDLASQPPRFFAALMEPGQYGARAAWQYATVAVPGSSPPLTYLGHLDVDGDGGTELILGVPDDRFPLHVLVVRREDDRWVQSLFLPLIRCQG